MTKLEKLIFCLIEERARNSDKARMGRAQTSLETKL